MRKIVCVSVPFILSQYHVNSIKETLESIHASKCSSPITTIGVANALRKECDDEMTLRGMYDEFILNDKNILSRAWNVGIKRAIALGATHILVHNLDLKIHSEAIERLANAADTHPEFTLFSPRLWWNKETLESALLSDGAESGGHMCCFMIRPNFFDLVGEFDELFTPAYQEDADMFHRMRLNNCRGSFVNDAFMYHTEGGTLRGCLTIEGLPAKDRITLASAIINRVRENNILYIEKWGDILPNEIYKTPYNKNISTHETKQSGYRLNPEK